MSSGSNGVRLSAAVMLIATAISCCASGDPPHMPEAATEVHTNSAPMPDSNTAHLANRDRDDVRLAMAIARSVIRRLGPEANAPGHVSQSRKPPVETQATQTSPDIGSSRAQISRWRSPTRCGCSERPLDGTN